MPGRPPMVTFVATLVLVGAAMPGAATAAYDARERALPSATKRSSAVTLTCAGSRYGPADEPAAGVLPAEYDRDGYKLTSRRDPALRTSPQNQCGRKGAAVDLAWGVTKGRDDVLIAVLDSGIRWRSVGAMGDLAHKAYINLAEARPPCAAADGDCNDDGVFDIADFGADHRPERRTAWRTPRISSSTPPTTTRSTTTATARWTTSPDGTSSTPTTTPSTPSTTGTAPERRRTPPQRRTDRGEWAPARAAASCRCGSPTRSSPTADASPRGCSSPSTPEPTWCRRRSAA